MKLIIRWITNSWKSNLDGWNSSWPSILFSTGTLCNRKCCQVPFKHTCHNDFGLQIRGQVRQGRKIVADLSKSWAEARVSWFSFFWKFSSPLTLDIRTCAKQHVANFSYKWYCKVKLGIKIAHYIFLQGGGVKPNTVMRTFRLKNL